MRVPVCILDQYQNPTYAILRLTDMKANNLSLRGMSQEDDVSDFMATETGHRCVNVCPLLSSFHVLMPLLGLCFDLNSTFLCLGLDTHAYSC